MFGSVNLTTVKLSGVGDSFKKHSDAESKGIKAHFNMDESGLLILDRVSAFSLSLAQLHSITVLINVVSVITILWSCKY